jgi:NAD(P)-dependent dehydrogenase (short-subunit alcohol dehydrogenase family)
MVQTLREGLLGEVAVLVAGHPRPGASPSLGEVVRDACAGLGARVGSCEPHATDEQQVDAAVKAVVVDTGGLDMLVLDGASLFAVKEDAHAALRACLDTAWNVTRSVINHAFLPAERGGRIVYLAPAPDAGEFAESARAGLENLSRTLSIEWARHGVNVVCIAPGASTAAGEVASICAYLASPAGAYFSGCLLDLRGP